MSAKYPNETTKESQYQPMLDIRQRKGLTRLGLMSNQVWNDDPRRVVFSLSRYKFVAKMFTGRCNVLEVGCGDAFASRIVKQEVERLTVIDFDPVFIADAKERLDPDWPMECVVHDIVASPYPGRFDAIYSLDVFEHIRPECEDRFIQHAIMSLAPHGVMIIGIPSLESQVHASPQSAAGHVNCKTAAELRKVLSPYFHSIFMFSMSDEVVHTGFAPMAHYLLAVCADCSVSREPSG
ncbi:MAG: class I SAM-dependent methyltransferase [Acidiferrobacteraceae bacterium]